MYGFAPVPFSSDTAFKDITAKEAACSQAITQFNTTLLLELVVGALLTFLYSRRILQNKTDSPKRISLLFVIIYLTVCILTMKYFSDRYMTACIEI